MTTQNKIKIRNFDEEVLNYFHKKADKIQYDELESDIIDDIKNGVGAAYRYNDEELRNRIGQLENNKLDKLEASELYPLKSGTYSKDTVDILIANLESDLSTELDNKLDLDKSKELFVQIKDGAITENLLSDDLIMKVNARYENQKPPEGGSGGGVPVPEFNLLKVQVSNNADSINSLQEYVNSNVMLNTDIIDMNQLDLGVKDLIEGARQEAEKIEMSDLSQDIQDKLAFAGEDNSELLQMIDSLNKAMNADRGEILIGDGVYEETGICKITSSFIYVQDVIIINDSQLLAEAETWARTQEIFFVADLSANVLYEYNEEEDVWKPNSDYNATEKLAGRFCSEYKTNDLYFGIDEFESIPIVRISDFISTSTLNNYLSKNEAGITYVTKQELTNTDSEISKIYTVINQLQSGLESINKKIPELEKELIRLDTLVQMNQTSIENIKTDIFGIINRLIALENK